MFWGLIMEPGKRYTQTVERAFHVSMACLESNTSDSENVAVMLVFDNKEFILCNLNKNKAVQSQLDLNFQSGDKIAFMTTGKGRVHLTGYLLETDDDEDDEDLDEEDMVMSEFNTKSLDSKKGNAKRKTEPQLKNENKKLKLEPESSVKSSSDEDEEEDEDDDDEEDEEEGGELSTTLDDSSFGLDDDDSDEEEEDEDDDDDEDEDEEDSDMEVDVTPKGKTPEQKKNNKQLNKTPNEQKITPNEKQKSKSAEKKKTPNEKQQQKIKTPDEKQKANTPNQKSPGQVNGIANQQQSGKKNKQKGLDTPKGAKTPGGGTPTKKVLEGGVIVEEIKSGNGPVAKAGRQVGVYYAGRLKSNNKQFDAHTQGPPFKFRLGRGEVIKGWDIGVSGMRVGDKRKITVPAPLGYGNKGHPPVIPPNSTLVFDVELKGVF